jgi:hypothetical protein
MKHIFVERTPVNYERTSEVSVECLVAYDGYDVVTVENNDIMITIAFPNGQQPGTMQAEQRAWELNRYTNYIETLSGVVIQKNIVDYYPNIDE